MTITATSDNQIRKSNIRNWTIGPPQLDNWAADLRHRLPTAERFSATGGYGMPAGSLWLDARELDHLGPLLGFFSDQLAEVSRRTRKHRAAEISEPRLHRGIGESHIDLLVECVD